MKAEFRDLYFGKSDSVNEALTSEADFIRSYVDIGGAVQQVTSGEKTLILGPKGTGKSALGLYLERNGRSDSSLYRCQMRSARNLPIGDIPELRTGQPKGAQRTYGAWKFILLCNYLDVALSDPNTRISQLRDVKRVIRTLRDAGFMGGESGRKLQQITNISYSIDPSSAGSLFKDEIGSRVDISTLTPYLEKWARSLRSTRRHILILDGLDSILLNDPRYDESIAGLSQAAYDINLDLREGQATGSIVLLLRNDIFSRISLILPDAHKMRDFAYDLDWRILSGGASENAPLIRLVNQKAAQGVGETEVDVLSYFPETITIGGRGHNRNRNRRQPKRLKYLLNLTRHTPRDILQLMEYVRLTEATNPSSNGSALLDQQVIREGVLQYSTKYFVDAVRGELAGYEGGVAETTAALNALKSLDSPRFTRSDYRRTISATAPGLEVKADDFLRLFFFAGALGNLFDNGSERYMVFYHRRNDVDLNVQGTLVLHNALTHAWSRPFGMREG
ncbi:P-loop ATPase, Sll1717 family [Cellulosimicrobium sp. 22601]|uniref:P-loop ATPase, Sll1717 family n=1 Tax=unclassified Cellulosimicrobium TaxID=2624466 RepID=UPI003F854B60